MRLLASSFVGSGVYTIRLTSKVGHVTGVLLDPHKLTIAGFWITSKKLQDHQLLLVQDIRTLVPEKRQIIIDDLKDLSSAEELPKLKTILEVDYQIPGKRVTQAKKRIGRAIDFGFSEASSYQVTNIVVKPPLLRRFNLAQLNFTRRQIQAINDNEIVIKSAEIKQKTKQKQQSNYGAVSYSTASAKVK